MIVVLVGESASGKSSIAKIIEERYPSFSKIIPYTTRPMRTNEKDGEEYHFISENEFSKMEDDGMFLECAKYRNWSYGSAKNDYKDSKNHVVILTPHGCRLLKRWAKKNIANIDVLSIYLNVDRRSRMKQLLDRYDDIDEAYRRNLSDVGQFDGFEDEANLVIENKNYHKSIEEVYSEIRRIINYFVLS